MDPDEWWTGRRERAHRQAILEEETADEIYLLLSLHQAQREVPRSTEEYRKRSEEHRKRRRRGVTRPSLLDPCKSAWERLYGSGCEQSLITFIGFDHKAFRALLVLFKPLYEQSSPYKVTADGRLRRNDARGRGGRPPCLSSQAALVMTLSYFRTMAQEYLLAVHFGVTHARYNLWGRFGRRVLTECLQGLPIAVPTFPSPEKIKEYNSAILAKHPALVDIYCVMDGLKLSIQRPGDMMTQERGPRGNTVTIYAKTYLYNKPLSGG
jgi:hypothetical protein